MSDAVLDYLSAHGPSLTSDVAQFLIDNHGLKPDAARQRVSRTRTAVKRLAYITFPRKARFIYLQQQYGSPQYWENLVEALIRTRSAYGLALEAILQRGGLLPTKHFAIACGAPMMQARHLSPDTIFNRLKQAQLLDKVLVSGIGECIVFSQYDGRYESLAQDVRARLITESVLLKAISDWSRKLGLVSYEKVSTRDGETLPRVGTFAWDLTAPSYLSFLTKGDDGQANRSRDFLPAIFFSAKRSESGEFGRFFKNAIRCVHFVTSGLPSRCSSPIPIRMTRSCLPSRTGL